MIRTDNEYKDSIRRFRQDKEAMDAQRQKFATMDFSFEEITALMEPMEAFHAQLCDEITWYENVCHGNALTRSGVY